MQTVSERVAIAIKKAPYKKGDIAKKVDKSYHTILRWSKGEKGDFKESEVEAISLALGISKEWLLFGRGGMYSNKDLNQIESAVNDAGEDYKGLDQTLSNVESKAENLKQDLQSLIDDLKKLRSHE